MNIYSISH